MLFADWNFLHCIPGKRSFTALRSEKRDIAVGEAFFHPQHQAALNGCWVTSQFSISGK